MGRVHCEVVGLELVELDVLDRNGDRRVAHEGTIELLGVALR